MLKLLFYLSMVFVPLFALALKPEGPLALALGGAGRAVTKAGAEYHLLNPASPAQGPKAAISGFYGFETQKSKPFWGVSLLENRQIPLGFSYLRERQTGEQYFSLSAGGAILPGWSLGLSLSRWEKRISTDWNVQAGILIKPKKSSFSIGAVWDHLLPVDEGAFKGQRRYGLGISYEPYQWLNLILDGLYHQEEEWKLMGGAVFLVSRFFILRAAFRRHFKQDTWLFSGGLGLMTNSLALDYGLSQKKDLDFLHSLNIRFAF